MGPKMASLARQWRLGERRVAHAGEETRDFWGLVPSGGRGFLEHELLLNECADGPAERGRIFLEGLALGVAEAGEVGGGFARR